MTLFDDGIDEIRAFAFPIGIYPSGIICEPLAILVKWRSSFIGKFHQVYVNREFAGSTIDSEQRKMVVHYSISDIAAQINVYAVEPEDANKDFSDEVTCVDTAGRASLHLLRRQNLPTEGTLQIYSNGGNGQIDYNQTITEEAIRIWPSWQDKGGFGMSRFGCSDLGYDGAAAVGFGLGNFGDGDFGFDADVFVWQSGCLEKGLYKFAVRTSDVSGNKTSEEEETDLICIVPRAIPASDISVESFNKGSNELVFQVL
ncbi:MAG: hypothetical protein ABIG61_08085 [Planctomycetota bacterium]